MPIYEYECTECGNRFEILQGINETPEINCSKCNSTKVERILSSGSFIFKGSGFYATDYKSKKEDKGKKGEVSGCTECADAASCPVSKEDN